MRKSHFLLLPLALVLTGFSSRGEASELKSAFVPHQELVTCEGMDGDIRVEVMIQVQDEVVGPQAVMMRLSDPSVSDRKSEIALFDYQDGVLNNSGSVVVGYIDALNPKTGRKGERIGGTFLGKLRSIMVVFDADFLAMPLVNQRHSAQVTYLKKIGEELVQDLDCVRQR